MSRIESTRENWPFQPWPARRGNTLCRWEDEPARTGTVISRTAARRWLLFTLVPIFVLGLASITVAHWRTDGGCGPSSEKSLGDSACPDQRLATLVSEHRRVVRGL